MRVGAKLIWWAVVCGIGLCFNAQAANIAWIGELPDEVTMHRSQAGVFEEDGWTQAVASKGNFEVKVPFKFEDWSVFIPEYEQFVHSIGGTNNKGVRLLVSEFPNFDNLSEFTSKAMSKSLLADVDKVRFRSVRSKEMDITQARFKLESGGASADTRYVVVRYIVVENTLFTLTVEAPFAAKRLAKKLESKFFKSFRLKSKK